jgi:glycosyltransferase involved in cell wall biosynthesis
MPPLVNRLFYTVKPLVPRSVQIYLRRQLAGRKRQACAAIWPIDPNSAKPPEGWPGWPGGKQFALVFSHDVDTRKGYDNVLKLSALEEKLGIRSCFNFVPERYGRVSLKLLEELRGRGFGVAVHGLKHDGKLFLSKRSFDRQALHINNYLKEWKAEGFTSPSMHHNLEWLVGLNIKFSISTFDTDPFEPQPDGVSTIFPFWVRNSSPNHGFVEMPYTLPQDSTLFIILQEKNIEIWKQKLDWIAEKGGMALLNTHPDYMAFNGGRPGEMEYPLQHYTDFLQYIQHRYSGKYFSALPEGIAAYCRDSCPRPELRGSSEKSSLNGRRRDRIGDHEQLKGLNEVDKPNRLATPPKRYLRAAMLTYSFYESDGRVRRYAETLAQRGDKVDVISLRREGQSYYNQLKGVNVYRVQERVRDEKGKIDYLSRIMKFFLRSLTLLTRKHLEHPYDLVHVHSVPDFEVFAALVPKLLGARVILDIHDIVPELYINKFKVKKSSVFRALVLAERASIGFSEHVIISNDLWRERLVSRSVVAEKCTSILNYPDDNLFLTNGCVKNSEKTILLYPGTLNHHQGLDIAVNAFAKIKDRAPNAEFHIYGDGPAKAGLAEQIRSHGLEDKVFLKDPVPLDEIVNIMAKADIGIIPKKNDGFGGEAFSTKTLEFMTLGVPIIVSRTRIDKFYFNESMVKFFEPDNIEDLAEAMLALINNRSTRDRLSVTAAEFAKKNCWGAKKEIYLNLVDSLCQELGGKRGKGFNARCDNKTL